MSDALHPPWLVAAWPGMGQVGHAAGYYLMAKLGMEHRAELSTREFFDSEQVEVKEGLIRATRLPRSGLYEWRDPARRRDLFVFLAEAQPSLAKHAFCVRLTERALALGVERVFTFAAMATAMHPEHAARVFGAATDPDSLSELVRLELSIVQDGQIGGLNGVLLGVAAELGLRGSCLLGEIPHMLVQIPSPKAALAVLEVFTRLAGIQLDLGELAGQAREMDRQLGQMMAQLQQHLRAQMEPEEPAPDAVDLGSEPAIPPAQEARIEGLFVEAAQDRAKAYELKRVLDELGLFGRFEDRFLDLFKPRT